MKLVADRLSSIGAAARCSRSCRLRSTAGEALLLLGPNGAGKTTLIRMIAGLLAPAAGAIRLDGGDAERSLGEQCHYVGHLNAVKSSLTVEENAAFWCRFLGGRRDGLGRRARGLRARSPARHPGRLPVGRAEAAAGARPRAAGRATVWLLDEPTVSLDRAAQEALTARRGCASRRRRPGGGGDARAARPAQRARAAARRHGRRPHERVPGARAPRPAASPGRRAAPSASRSASIWSW